MLETTEDRVEALCVAGGSEDCTIEKKRFLTKLKAYFENGESFEGLKERELQKNLMSKRRKQQELALEPD